MLNLLKNTKFLSILFGGIIFNPLLAVTWSAPVDISPAGKDAVSPQVALDARNTATLVWSQYNGSNYLIETTTSKSAGSWLPPQSLSNPGGDSFFSRVATDKQGNSIAVWTKKTKTNYVIQSATQFSKGKWSNPVTLSASGTVKQNAQNPQIAVGAKGNAIAIWQWFDGTTNIIQASSRKAQDMWSQPYNLTASVPGGDGNINPQITIDANGNAIAVWENNPTGTVQATVKPYNNLWTTPVTISTPGLISSQPQITVDPSGNAIVVWTGSDDTNRIIQSSTLQNGIWSAPVSLSDSGQDAQNPQIAIDPAGNNLAIWERYDGMNTIIQASFKPFGSSWISPVNLSDSGQDASNPQVDFSSTHVAGVVWKRSDGSNFIIQATTKSPSGFWTPPVSLSAVGEDAVDPQIVLGKFGFGLVTWTRFNGMNSVIEASYGQF